MITEIDTGNIIYKDAAVFGVTRYRKDVMERVAIKAERAVVITKPQTSDKIWLKNYVELNLCVPDVKGNINLTRLNELERQAKAEMSGAGTYDGTTYVYDVDSTELKHDSEFKMAYINVRILFRAINTKQ